MKRILFAFASLLPVAFVSGQTITEKLQGSVNGRVYFDGTAFFKDKTHLGSGATISDIRLGVSGTYENFSGKIDIGFAKKSISLKDVFFQYNFRPHSYARIGHFAEPFGLDYMESSGNIRFINAGCVTEAFAPGRKLGLEYIGWSKQFWYAGGLFGDTHFDQKLDYKGNDGYALTARGVYNPLKSKGRILHAGMAMSFRTPDALKDNTARRSVSYGANLGSMVNSTKFVNAEISDVNHTFKVAGEFIGAVGRFSLQGEYFHTQANRKQDLKKYKAWGTYGQIGFLAIGTGYEYATSWARLELPKPGSLEFALRYSCLDLNDKSTGILGGQQQQITFGCNYYWKKFVRLRLNYNFAHLDKHALNGKEDFHFISARIQVFLN
ncbi:MAG: hypothetical protein K2L23_08220 [Odoribacter sp.]|nr:hypothetical protein [Odoribacter sp.]